MDSNKGVYTYTHICLLFPLAIALTSGDGGMYENKETIIHLFIEKWHCDIEIRKCVIVIFCTILSELFSTSSTSFAYKRKIKKWFKMDNSSLHMYIKSPV